MTWKAGVFAAVLCALLFQNCGKSYEPESSSEGFSRTDVVDLDLPETIEEFFYVNRSGPTTSTLSPTPTPIPSEAKKQSGEVVSRNSNEVEFRGEVYRFSVGAKKNLQYEKNYDGKIVDLGGLISSEPSAVVFQDDIYVFVRGGQVQDLWVRAVFKPEHFWGSLGQPSSSIPRAIASATEGIFLFYVNSGTLWQMKLPTKSMLKMGEGFLEVESTYQTSSDIFVEARNTTAELVSRTLTSSWTAPPIWSLAYREKPFLEAVSTFSDPLIDIFRTSRVTYDRTIWVTASENEAMSGAGTEQDPYRAPKGDLDPVMQKLMGEYLKIWFNHPEAPRVRVFLTKGSFTTKGFSLSATNPHHWVLPSRWTLEGAGMLETRVKLASDLVLPLSSNPAIEAASFQVLLGHSPGIGDIKPHDQIIRNLTVDGGFSELAPAFKNANKQFNNHGVLIFGDQSGIENVRFLNFGASGRVGPAQNLIVHESFVAMVAGSAMRPWPSGTSFAPGWITGCLYEGVPHELSRGQVTIFGVAGGYSSEPMDPLRKDYLRKGALLTRNRVILEPADSQGGERTSNQGFQGLSFFRVDGAIAAYNEIVNAGVGYYTDWWRQKNVVIRNNRFLNAANGVALHTDVRPNFREEHHRIYDNIITVAPTLAGGRAGLRVSRYKIGGETWQFYSGAYRRYISGIEVQGNLLLYSSRLSSAQYDQKYAMLFSDQDGLVVTNNIIDKQFSIGKKNLYSALQEQCQKEYKYLGSVGVRHVAIAHQTAEQEN